MGFLDAFLDDMGKLPSRKKKEQTKNKGFQQTHSEAKILMYAKDEINLIVTKQTSSFYCKCTNIATRYVLHVSQLAPKELFPLV